MNTIVFKIRHSLSAGIRLTFLVAGLCVVVGSRTAQSEESDAKDSSKKPVPLWSDELNPGEWGSLFDGKSLEGWDVSKFGGEGDVYVEKGQLFLGTGNDITGIHTERKLPKINYEVRLEAMRVEGSDFFCGLTFPVEREGEEDPCSLILGGWGGGVCGLSSIDGFDASENATTTYQNFENEKWYQVRLRVTEELIEAWVDDELIVYQELEDRRVSIRFEVEPSQPFGVCSFQTTAALRKFHIRELPAQDEDSES